LRVLLLTDRVVGYGSLQREGDVIEVCQEEGVRMIKAGQAESMEKIDPTETETRVFTEDASLPRNKRGKLFKRLRS